MQDKRYLKHAQVIPYDPDCFTYVQSEGAAGCPFEPGGFHPYEYNGWIPELRSTTEGVFIHAGLNPNGSCMLKGPDAVKVLSDWSVNGFKTFDIGRTRHVIMVNDDGQIIKHGTAIRLSEDEVLTSWLWPYLEWCTTQGDYDVQCIDMNADHFIYQVGGPRSLEVVEQACHEDLHDLKFLGLKYVTIGGRPCFVMRIGMCGTLAYEVHAHAEGILDVYNAILEAGKPYGIERMGRHAYRVIHTEGGFPQVNYHFFHADGGAAFGEWMKGVDVYGGRPLVFRGSADPEAERLTHDPFECGWGKMVKFNHDFRGREALEKAAEKHRDTTTLEWDVDDILEKVYKAQLDPNSNVTFMEWGEDYEPYLGSMSYRVDNVLSPSGEVVGLSTGRLFSPHYGRMISMACIDPEYLEEGSELFVLWGDRGTNQVKIRAKVARYPYVNEFRNESYDVEQIPHPEF